MARRQRWSASARPAAGASTAPGARLTAARRGVPSRERATERRRRRDCAPAAPCGEPGATRSRCSLLPCPLRLASLVPPFHQDPGVGQHQEMVVGLLMRVGRQGFCKMFQTQFAAPASGAPDPSLHRLSHADNRERYPRAVPSLASYSSRSLPPALSAALAATDSAPAPVCKASHGPR